METTGVKADPADDTTMSDRATDVELTIDRAFRKAGDVVKRTTGLSIGAMRFSSQVEPSGSKLALYAPLNLRLTVEAFDDPADSAEELVDALEALCVEARKYLR